MTLCLGSPQKSPVRYHIQIDFRVRGSCQGTRVDSLTARTCLWGQLEHHQQLPYYTLPFFQDVLAVIPCIILFALLTSLYAVLKISALYELNYRL